MAERMTTARLAERVENVNRRLEAVGSRKRVDVSHRYDYYGLDEGTGEGREFVPHSDPIRVGSKGEIGDALWIMMRALDLASEKA